MRCQFEVMVQILDAIEMNTPSLFIDDLRLESRTQNRYRKNTSETPAPENLEVSFNLYAFLKNPVEKKDEK